MITSQTKDLFQLQTELVDMKVDMAVSKAVTQVIDQINQLKNDMHSQFNDLRHEMRDRFSLLENRVTAVETKLGIVSEARKAIRNRFIDYCFKGGWLVLAATVSYFVLQLQLLIK